MMNRARSGPACVTTPSRESSHSCVSAGSMSGSCCLNWSKISCIGRLWYRPSPLWTDERGQALSGARCRLFREQRPDGEVVDGAALPPRDRYAQDEMPRCGAELGPQHRGDLIGDVGLDDSAMVNDALRAICGPEGR